MGRRGRCYFIPTKGGQQRRHSCFVRHPQSLESLCACCSLGGRAAGVSRASIWCLQTAAKTPTSKNVQLNVRELGQGLPSRAEPGKVQGQGKGEESAEDASADRHEWPTGAPAAPSGPLAPVCA